MMDQSIQIPAAAGSNSIPADSIVHIHTHIHTQKVLGYFVPTLVRFHNEVYGTPLLTASAVCIHRPLEAAGKSSKHRHDRYSGAHSRCVHNSPQHNPMGQVEDFVSYDFVEVRLPPQPPQQRIRA